MVWVESRLPHLPQMKADSIVVARFIAQAAATFDHIAPAVDAL